jgi:Pro-kumamolisin, activation domain
MEVSTPKSSKYGKFLTRSDLATLTANPEASSIVEDYLTKHGATITRMTKYGEYITAKASLSIWEELFDTKFELYQSVNTVSNSRTMPSIYRAGQYSLDSELVDYVEAVFQTTQFPTVLPPKVPMKKLEKAGTAGHITPATLNSYYNITTNTGNSLASQSVFESLGQYYSASDLLQFEALFGIPLYNVTTDIGGYESDAECVDDANNCAEANLG